MDTFGQNRGTKKRTALYLLRDEKYAPSGGGGSGVGIRGRCGNESVDVVRRRVQGGSGGEAASGGTAAIDEVRLHVEGEQAGAGLQDRVSNQ